MCLNVAGGGGEGLYSILMGYGNGPLTLELFNPHVPLTGNKKHVNMNLIQKLIIRHY